MPQASTISFISWTIETVLKKTPVSWEGWMLVSDPELGLLMRALHGLAGGSEGGCLQLRGHGDTSSLAGLGWVPARQVSVAQNQAGRFAAVWRGIKEGGAWEGGWAASSPLQEAASFQVGSTLAEGLGGRMPRACPAQLLERCLPSPGLSVPWH